jgi:Tol biopolymer transport system component
MARGLGTRFTFDDAEDTGGIWSPDGHSVTFSSNRNGPFAVYEKALAGTTEETLLYAGEKDTFATAWHPGGEVLAVMERGEAGGFDISLLRIAGDTTSEPFLHTPFFEYGAVFSPDGRWIAYGSDESGEWHVYVQPFPGPGRKWQVSTQPGVWPQWARGGKEILFLGIDGTVSTAAIEVQGESLVVGAAEALFETSPLADDYRFAVSPVADRLLLFEPLQPTDGAEAPPPLNVLVNWPATLDRS